MHVKANPPRLHSNIEFVAAFRHKTQPERICSEAWRQAERFAQRFAGTLQGLSLRTLEVVGIWHTLDRWPRRFALSDTNLCIVFAVLVIFAWGPQRRNWTHMCMVFADAVDATLGYMNINATPARPRGPVYMKVHQKHVQLLPTSPPWP